jgi:hypothetical protein
MGSGTYSYSSHVGSRSAKGYEFLSSQEIFKSRNINSSMNPFGVGIRESRDSANHPNSLAIVLALDVTGSMGSVPHYLVKDADGIPKIMNSLITNGIPDPQMLFLGIGDHNYDSSPLQVGQFESSGELLDKWLTDIYLEGGGGGNDGESYLLAWYFAAYHTAIDCFEKRGQKGCLITIGDEPQLPSVPINVLKKLMGEGQYENFTAQVLLDKAMEKYNVYHINVKATSSGSRQRVIDGWHQLLSDNLHIAERREDVADIVVDIIKESAASSKQESIKSDIKLDEMML